MSSTLHSPSKEAITRPQPAHRLSQWWSAIRRFPLLAVFLAWVILLTSSWLADAIKGEVFFIAQPTWLRIGLIAVGFIGASVWLYVIKGNLIRMNTIKQGQKFDPHPGVILLLSTPTYTPTDDTLHTWQSTNPPTRTLSVTFDPDVDIAELDRSGWNWLQVLRSLNAHAGTLKYVVLIGSQNDARGQGSAESFAIAKQLFERYFPTVTVFPGTPTGVDYEDFDALTMEIDAAVQTLRNAGLREDQIVIDITGGTKVVSIAGAAYTLLNDKVSFQYVQTRPPSPSPNAPQGHETLRVQMYNIVVQPPVTPD